MKQIMNLVTALALLLAMALPAFSAGVPTTLAYQGSLTDKAGTGISGSRTLVFSLYGVDTGGSASWSEQQAVTVTAGKFSAVLGSSAPLDVSVLSGDTWLGIAVLGEPEMTPRQKLTSVAYSLRAKVADSVISSDSLIPAGTVVAFAGTVAPDGWLLCDGTLFDAVSEPQYQRLFNAIDIAHGGDKSAGQKKFNVPDYRGRFLRGVDGVAGVEPAADKAARAAMKTGGNTGNAVGSVQGDVYGRHSHTISVGINFNGAGSLYNMTYANTSNTPQINQGNGTADPVGGNETRPKNAYVNWIIKY